MNFETSFRYELLHWGQGIEACKLEVTYILVSIVIVSPFQWGPFLYAIHKKAKLHFTFVKFDINKHITFLSICGRIMLDLGDVVFTCKNIPNNIFKHDDMPGWRNW
ncbi:MAG: hypothetical protein CSA29_03265 [Desulfobacterales bacterium]|nr:MAG: hypothetical protein CSA29_03265 [Desulfobacterales bacterium]